MKYSYIKKFNVDYNMNPAPWAKKGCGSFNSKVSFKLLRFQKRKLNKRFYNSQDIYLKKVIQYFYLRYCEDFQRDTYQSFKSIFRNLRHLLIGNFFSQSYYASNWKTFLMQVRLLNIYMSSYSFNYLNKLTYLTYQQVVGSYKLLGLKVTKVLPAKNTLDFFPLRGSPPVDKHKGYSGELKGFFKGFIK